MLSRLKRKKFLLLVLALACGLAAFSYGRGAGISPVAYFQKFQQGFQDALAPVHGFLAGLGRRLSFQDHEESRQLTEEVSRLRQQVRALEEEKKTWELWQEVRKDLYGDLPHGIAARVIATDPSPQRRSVTLDKGSRDGLHPGQVVLAQGGLVGRLVQVSEKTSQVLLLTDPISVVDVLTQSTRTRGTLKGEADPFHLGGEYFLTRDALQAGDLLLTSGQDGIFPKGIAVGIVRQLQRDESGIFYRAEVEPVVRMDKLEIVEILQV